MNNVHPDTVQQVAYTEARKMIRRARLEGKPVESFHNVRVTTWDVLGLGDPNEIALQYENSVAS
jgi:hypothetical protein